MKEDIDLEKKLAAFENGLDELVKENLAKLMNALKNPPTAAKSKKQPPIARVTAIYVDRENMIPLGIYEYEVMGTQEEVARLIQAKHEALIDSPEYRKNQNQLFAILKDKYGMRDSKILDMLIPDASRDERDKVYNRLKRSYARIKAARTGTKR